MALGNSSRKPDFWIVGAPKCGTSAMHEYLRQHPQIFIPRRMEMHFFGSDLVFPRGGKIGSLEEYLGYFAGASDGQRVGEKSVWYLYSDRAAREIREFCSAAQIIVMLRNPADMLYSLHSQFLYTGNEDIEDFQAALDAEEDRKRGQRLPRTMINPAGLLYRHTIRFAEQLQRYFDAFGRENVHAILFDDLKNDAARTYRDTLRFLGVNEEFQPDLVIVNPNKRVYSVAVRDFVESPSGLFQRVGRALLPRRLRQVLRRRLSPVVRRVNTRYVRRGSMDPALRRWLADDLRPQVEALAELLGRDLSAWYATR